MAFCTKCGKENSDSAQFCTGCGNSLPVSQSPVRAPVSITGSIDIAVLSGFLPTVICSVIGFLLYWFPWVSINMWPVLRSFSGSELAKEPNGSMYFLIPLYCITVLVCIVLQVKGMITVKQLKIVTYAGFGVLLLIPIDSYFQSVQAVKQAEKMFGAGFTQSIGKAMGQELKDAVNYTVWYYIELLALLGNVVSMVIARPKLDAEEKV